MLFYTAIQAVKFPMINLFALIPTPKPLTNKTNVLALKERLDWGEPALTIIDLRNRTQFNTSRILGAISIPMDELLERVVDSLERNRDIYLYCNDNAETAQAAARLRRAGYRNVAEIIGGLPAWRAVDGPTEGTLPAVLV